MNQKTLTEQLSEAYRDRNLVANSLILACKSYNEAEQMKYEAQYVDILKKIQDLETKIAETEI
jgi:hypothetical protein